jgi:hypothetical protein
MFHMSLLKWIFDGVNISTKPGSANFGVTMNSEFLQWCLCCLIQERHELIYRYIKAQNREVRRTQWLCALDALSVKCDRQYRMSQERNTLATQRATCLTYELFLLLCAAQSYYIQGHFVTRQREKFRLLISFGIRIGNIQMRLWNHARKISATKRQSWTAPEIQPVRKLWCYFIIYVP